MHGYGRYGVLDVLTFHSANSEHLDAHGLDGGNGTLALLAEEGTVPSASSASELTTPSFAPKGGMVPESATPNTHHILIALVYGCC
jgi:hypothetical protein